MPKRWGNKSPKVKLPLTKSHLQTMRMKRIAYLSGLVLRWCLVIVAIFIAYRADQATKDQLQRHEYRLNEMQTRIDGIAYQGVKP